ncbi:MAG: DUF2341 domain-containing protein, partial [Candidatus Hodarchaeales archaeon]
DVWHHIVATYDGSTMRIYIDGVQDSNTMAKTGNIEASSINEIWIGHADQPADVAWSGEWEGLIDEVRISNVSRNANWIKTEYNNQNDPQTFLSIGSKQSYKNYDWPFPMLSYRKKIIINADKVSSDLTDFALLIDLYDVNLHDTTKVQADGDDILFADASGIKLGHEIEFFDQAGNGTHAHLVAWIRIPHLPKLEDTSIFMYYGNNDVSSLENPSAVWNNNYLGVWHLSEASGSVHDSTSNSYDGLITGASYSPSSFIDGGYEFIRSETDSIEMPETANTLQLTEFTVEAWIKTPDSSVPDDYYIATQSLYSATTSWALNIADDSGHENEARFTTRVSSQQIVYSNTVVTDNGWHHLVGVRNSTALLLYVDGSLAGSATDSEAGQLLQSPVNVSIGSAISTSTEDFNGTIDEVRISNVARSAAWFETQYNNQFDPDSFYSIEIEESSPIEDNWAFPQFNYRKTITIDSAQVTTDQTNFPVLLNLSDSDLVNGKVQADGDDIIFTDNLGTQLDHEIEYFDQTGNGTHAYLVTWVKVPSLLSSTDTNITMYYGNNDVESQWNPEGVWDSNYLGVWHLSEDPTGTIFDSTFHDLDGTSYGSMTSNDQTTGQVDGSLDFDGSDDYINCSDPLRERFDASEKYTCSAWIKAGSIPGGTYPNIASDEASDGSTGWDFYWFENTVRVWSCDAYTDVVVSPSLTQGNWYYVAFTYDNGALELFVNGTSVDTGSNTFTDSTGNFLIGVYFNDSYYFNGIIDEVRISNIVRSSNFIETEYINQHDPDSFYSVGPEEIHKSDQWAFPLLRYRKFITIDANKVNGSGVLPNFPVLLNLSDSDLYASDKVQADGDDILFTDCFGNRLDHEIELFDQTGNGTHAHLVTWVKVPILSTQTNTNITMYYGNNAITSQEDPEGLWENNYVGVWHLSESSGDALDSTSYGASGTVTGGVTQGITGQVHNTYDFNGVDSKVDMGDPADGHLDFGTGSFTVETWIYRNSSMTSDQYGGIFKGNGDVADQNGWLFRFKGSDTVRFSGGDGTASVFNIYKSSSLIDETWIHLVGVLDRAAGRAYIYMDGQLIATDTSITGGNIDSTRTLKLSEDWSSSFHFKGFFDEIRLSNIARSAAWIATEYNNQYDPNSFYSIDSEEEHQNWWADASFSKRKDIVIDRSKVSGDLSNFPVLIDITDGALKNGKIQPDADDVVFLSEGNIKLNHEIEYFSQNSSHGHLIAWVNVPTLFNDTDTLISMYYGNEELSSQENPPAVWDKDYVGIWHLNEEAGDAQDSTSYGTNGAISGGVTQDVAGQSGKCYDFDGIDGTTVNFTDPIDGHLDFGTNSFTVSFWVNIDQNTGDYQLPIYKGGASNPDDGYEFETTLTGDNVAFYSGDGTETFSCGWSGISFDTWYYFVGVNDRSTNYIHMYQDGIYIDSTDISTLGSVDSANSFVLSRTDYPIDGMLDEVRVSKGIHSLAWIQTEYNNQYDPASFYSVGSEYLSPLPEPSSFGFVWLDTPNEIDLGSTYNSWVEQDLSDDGIPSIATGVILAWAEMDAADTPAIARGIEDTNDYMNGGSIYNEFEDKTWKMQIVKLGTNRSIETWRGEVEDKLYVMGYTIGSDPWYRPVPTDLGTLIADSTWHTATVGGVDDDTTGVILLGQSLSSIDSIVAVRAVGSTDDVTTRLWQEYNSGMIFVRLNENDQFEYYVNQSTKFYVIAEIKNSIDWLDTNRDDISPSSGWTIRDLDSYITVPSSASGVILQFESTDSSDHLNLLREYGQDWTFPSPGYDIGSKSWMMVGSGIGPGNQIELYSETGTPDAYNYIHAVTIYSGESPPMINNFGVDETGTGIGEFWADIIDYTSSVENVTLKFNETEHSMSFNGTYWTSQQSVNYGGFYTYQIINASNGRDNYLVTPSEEKNNTFTVDKIAPNVLQWTYISENNTFHANVTDSWGEIDTVRVNVTTHNLNATMV